MNRHTFIRVRFRQGARGFVQAAGVCIEGEELGPVRIEVAEIKVSYKRSIAVTHATQKLPLESGRI